MESVQTLIFLLLPLIKFSVLCVPFLLVVPFFVLCERKVLGLVGIRLGPFKVSAGGFLQSFGDAGKLMSKSFVGLNSSSTLFYYVSSSMTIFCSLLLLCVVCSNPWGTSLKAGVLLFLILLGVNSLNLIISGWSSNGKYSLLGSIRSVSQLVSYEVLIYTCLFFFLCVSYSFDFLCMFLGNPSFFMILSPLLVMVWYLSVTAELNRTPYDFSESESELVSGFNTDFGSACFTLIFLSEYGNIFFFMALTSLLFFFGDLNLLLILSLLYVSLWSRSVLPRYRFDKLIGLSWKVLLPQAGFFFVFFFLALWVL